MGIYIAEEYRGNGYGLETIKLSTEYMFRFHVYRSIHLEVFSYNEGAYRLYQKAGFKECGRFHNSRYFNGKFYDIILMEMLKNQNNLLFWTDSKFRVYKNKFKLGTIIYRKLYKSFLYTGFIHIPINLCCMPLSPVTSLDDGGFILSKN